jgi:hypothetical protein
MTEESGDAMDFSLAELAGVDMGEIAEVSFEGLPAGLYLFKGTEAKLEKVRNAKDEPRGKVSLQMEVVEVKSITERGQDPEDWLAKKHRENIWIVPDKPEEGLGMIVRFFNCIGLPSQGPLGGCTDDDGNPVEGILDNFPDHEFLGKITKKPRKGDPATKDSVLTPVDVRKPEKKAA